jgi:hypothetical protein
MQEIISSWKKYLPLFCIIIVVSGLIIFFTRQTSNSSKQIQKQLVEAEKTNGRVIASRKFAELEDKYPSYRLREFSRCVNDGITYYEVYLGAGFGAGERYIYAESGEEVYYELCDTMPADGCYLKEKRGAKPYPVIHQCERHLQS